MMDKTQGGPTRCCGLADIEVPDALLSSLRFLFMFSILERSLKKSVIQYFAKNTLREKRPILASSVMRK